VTDAPIWQLEDFEERLDTWVALENPPDDLVREVLAWILGRYDDPYQGVRREPGFDNLWYGVVPGTAHGHERVVTCSYWITETTRTVRCNSIATLSWPA
jgi:hypothetical protein